MIGKYLVGTGGSAAKRNLHLSALRGFFDRMGQRRVVLQNPAASITGVKGTVVEGKTPEITIDQARKLIASVKTTCAVKVKDQKPLEFVSGLLSIALSGLLSYPFCRQRVGSRFILPQTESASMAGFPGRIYFTKVPSIMFIL
jgi:hypothetical protein